MTQKSLAEQQAELLEDALAQMRDSRCRGLNLSRILFGKEHVDAIAAELPRSGLRHLALGREELKDSTLATLIDALPDCPELETLRLHSGGRMGESSLQKLAEVLPRSTLASIEFDAYYPVESDAMHGFIEAAGRSGIREFAAYGQNFGDKDVEALVPLITSGQLTHVKINRGIITAAGAEKLFDALNGSKVEEFEFKALAIGEQPTEKSMHSLKAALQEGTLTSLGLPHMRLDTKAAEILAEGIKGSNLRILSLSDNPGIGEKGLAAIAAALPESPVRTLGIDRCSPQAQGYEVLFDALPRTKVQELHLFATGMQHSQTQKLTEVLPHTNLRALHMPSNIYSEAGLGALVKAISASGLAYLDIRNISLDMAAESLKHSLPVSGLGYLDIRKKDLTANAMRHVSEGVAAGHLGMIQCYGSDTDAAVQQAADASYQAAAQNNRTARALAYKLHGQPQAMTAGEWESAASHLGAIRVYIDQNWKTDDFFPIKPEETDHLLLQRFAQAAEMGHTRAAARAIMCLLPYDDGIEALASIGIDCKAAALLAPDGALLPGQLCRGGVERLFSDADRWDSTAQYSTCYNKLPDALKEQVPNMHSTRFAISERAEHKGIGR